MTFQILLRSANRVQTWDPEVFCIDINTSQGSSKYFPDLQTILPILSDNTSQHMWIVINTSKSQNCNIAARACKYICALNSERKDTANKCGAKTSPENY